MEPNFTDGWKTILQTEIEKDYFKKLMKDVDFEYQNHICYPPKELIFNAFDKCVFENLKVVILGQDPYHGAGEANGLAFSVNNDVKTPPSLKNIFKEINPDCTQPNHLERWAKQGVLLLNVTLTVRENLANSHQKMDWKVFTKAVIQQISDKKEGVVFLLWGKFAQQFAKDIAADKHKIFVCGHPSFAHSHKQWFGNNHFAATNVYLESKGLTAINWCI
jgi:uracil-DNA glycosylase